MNIGENIRKLRELKNYSQDYMANELDMVQKTYSNIETAGNKITVETILRVAKVLEINYTKIFELNTEAILNNSNQSGGLNQLNTAPTTNNIYDKNNELYEKLLAEKDLRIEVLEQSLKTLKG